MDIVELTRLWTAGFSSWKIAEQLGAKVQVKPMSDII
jgi:hypothetical protein